MEEVFVFYIGKAAKLIGVTPTTIRRWHYQGKIHTDRNQMNKWRMFSLAEINRIRKLRGLHILSKEEVIDLFDMILCRDI